MAAAGPFTTNDNLAYEPLVELLTYARKIRPNVLILVFVRVDGQAPSLWNIYDQSSELETLSYFKLYCASHNMMWCMQMGPFVDSEHPQIKQGTINKLFSHIFQEEVRMRVMIDCYAH